MNQRIGVIGLGAMGRGMAQSLRRAGYHVHVSDVRAEAAQAFAAEGGTACAHPADVAAACEVLVSVVNDPVETAARGANALAHARAELSWDGLVPRFEAVYAQGIERRRRRGAGEEEPFTTSVRPPERSR